MISWILSLSAVLHMWLMGNKWKWAPLMGVIAQAGWIYFAISEEQFGFIPGAICFIFVNFRNHLKWINNESEKTKDN